MKEYIKQKRLELNQFIELSNEMYQRNPSADEIEDWLESFLNEATQTGAPKIADLKKQVTEHFNSENIILDNIKDEISEKEYEYRKAELKRQKFFIMLILISLK